MGLDGSTCSESLPERTCHFESPEHVPRASARAQTCARGPGGLPACHGAESTRKGPRPEEKQMPKGQKDTFIRMYRISLRKRVRSDKKAIKKLSIRAGINTSKSNCARKKVYYLGVEEDDARANAYYRCGCGCTLLIYVARYV